jgi:hypothetical protein
MKTMVKKLTDIYIEFENGIILYTNHDSECCESHYLSLEDLTIDDFKGLEFDLDSDNLINKVEGYGIELNPVNGYPIRIPGYGYNNGCYSDDIELILFDKNSKKEIKKYDITDCQNESKLPKDMPDKHCILFKQLYQQYIN